jgi:hypothetical protein
MTTSTKPLETVLFKWFIAPANREWTWDITHRAIKANAQNCRGREATVSDIAMNLNEDIIEWADAIADVPTSTTIPSFVPALIEASAEVIDWEWIADQILRALPGPHQCPVCGVLLEDGPGEDCESCSWRFSPDRF